MLCYSRYNAQHWHNTLCNQNVKCPTTVGPPGNTSSHLLPPCLNSKKICWLFHCCHRKRQSLIKKKDKLISLTNFSQIA